MEQLSKLEQEFVRVKLYGVSPAKRPRSAEAIAPELHREWGEKAADREKELNAILLQIVAFGKDACNLKQEGFDRDSLEYDSLVEKCAAHSEIANQFALQCFNNGTLPSGAQNLVVPEETENTMDVSGETESTKDAPEETDSSAGRPDDAVNSADLLQSIMNNSFTEEREISDPDWGTDRNTIMSFRCWTNDVDKMRELEAIVAKLEKRQSSHLDEARKLLENGKQIAELQDRAFRAKNSHEVEELVNQAKAIKATHKEIDKIRFQYEKKLKKRELANKKVSPVRIPPPDYDTDGPNPHFVRNLPYSPEWTIMVDESGKVFDDSLFSRSYRPNEKGHFVAVLIPKGTALSPLGQFHSVDSEPQVIANCLNTLLHTSIPCGILGITLDGMANAPVNYWYNGLERLFDLILRLLPVGEDGVRLNVYVEARGRSTPEMVRRTIDSSLYRLAKVDQSLASRIRLDVQTIGKYDSEDETFNAWNGYVDAVAYSWCCFNQDLNDILLDYGLRPSCLMEGSSQNLYEIMDDLKCGRLPKPEFWSELITMCDAGKPDSLVSRLLAGIGFELRGSLPDWKTYLNHLIGHLDSKAINLSQLGKQISFLKKYQPDDSALPPRIKLLWLTAKLAEANHRGAIVVEAFDRFRKLTRELYEEDAPLTCYATLHLAVTYTNAYRFQEAQKVIGDYLALISTATWGKNLPAWIHSVFDLLMSAAHIEPASPAAIPGLRYFAQLISSHGQHEAFFGRNAEAVKFFLEANRLFSRLSDRKQAAKEISQTSAYLLTALMDMDHPDPALLDATLKSYFGDDLLAAAHALAATDEPVNKYRLHILLRCILSGKVPSELKAAVLEEKENWKTASGHPWEMIEFYRGLLLDAPVDRMKHLKNARELCKGHDATLHVIEAVILGTILLEDASVEQSYRELVERCAAELPDLGSERVAALREQPVKRRPALELAGIVLPFNFR